MKKLLELRKLQEEIKCRLNNITTPIGTYICLHTITRLECFISIYTASDFEDKRTLKHKDIIFEIDNNIDEQTADEIIAKIEEALQ